MNIKGLVSVIIPTYNRAGFLEEALKSVLNQTYSNLEIIVVDDGSTDNTKEVLKPFKDKIKYFYQENKGPAAAKNTGLKSANGEYIAFLDSDDLWPSSKIEIQIENISDSENVNIVMGGVRHQELSDFNKNEYKDLDETYNRNSLGCGLFKASTFKKVGLFNENLTYWEDLDWLLRAAELGIITERHSQIALIVRLHRENMSKNVEAANRFLSIVLKDSIARRRSKAKGKVEKVKLWSWAADEYQ